MKRVLALVGVLACLAGAARAGPAADAEAALDNDDYAKAFALYSQAVAEAGKDSAARASALFDRAEAYARYARDPEALADYDEALSLSLDKGFKALVLSSRGDLYVHERHFQEAIADYTQALSLKPDLVGVLTDRGQAHQRLKENDAALADFDAELKADPKYPKALRAKARLLGQPDPTQVSEHPW
ncbi:MAG TPA: tetratricopeptide repeat protein [Caulobacteraceae bacterium]|jgi:tetratricopeptide (TPR) repeat protein